MPVRVNSAALKADGQHSIHCPGAYGHVLQLLCKLATEDRHWWLTEHADAPGAIEEHEAEEAEKLALEMEVRRGEPVICQSWQLPEGLAAPFHNFPGHQRLFTVDPTDVITEMLRGLNI